MLGNRLLLPEGEKDELHECAEQEAQEGAVEVVDGAQFGVDEDVEVSEQIVEQLPSFAVEDVAVLSASFCQFGRRRRCFRWGREGVGAMVGGCSC